MLAKKFRLPSSTVFRNAKTIKDASFMVKVQFNNLSYSRFGFVVAKTIDKRATVRNRLKRLIRSSVEEKWLQTKGYDVLFVLRPAIKKTVKDDMLQRIDALLAELLS